MVTSQGKEKGRVVENTATIQAIQAMPTARPTVPEWADSFLTYAAQTPLDRARTLVEKFSQAKTAKPGMASGKRCTSCQKW